MKKRYLYFLLLLLNSFAGKAFGQSYPVQAGLFLQPPYSVYLSDYAAAGTNRLAVNLLLTDFSRDNLQVRLRFSLEGLGTGFQLRTKPHYLPAPLTLPVGSPLRLSGDELAGYLSPENLQVLAGDGQAFLRTGKLPEDVYRICIEVLEYNRNEKVSNSGCATAWVSLNDPPLLNFPANAAHLRAQQPQNIRFNWTPLHTGSPNSAFTTEYEFTLVELWPETVNPNQAIQSSIPIFQDQVNMTSLHYGLEHPPLVAGRSYAWRIRAKSMVGVEEMALFKNGGYSQVYSFKWGEACHAPAAVEVKPYGTSRLQVLWQADPLQSEFIVSYRPLQEEEGNWYSETTYLTDHIIGGLQPETRYEVKVQALCGSVRGAESAVVEGTTEVDRYGEFACGAAPAEFELDNTTPLPNLQRGDYIKAGDLEVRIDSVGGSSGTFSGTGIASMPFLNLIQLRVRFENIKVNTDYRMFQGYIVTVWNPNSKMEANIGTGETEAEGTDTESGEEEQDGSTAPVAGDFQGEEIDHQQEIDSVYVNPEGQIVVVDVEGEETLYERDPEAEQEYQVTDPEGNVYVVDSGGNVTKGGGGSGTVPDPPDAISSPDSINYIVRFAPDEGQEYGFDSKESNAGDYGKTQIQGEDYQIAWKSVETGRQDRVKVLTVKDTFPQEVGFKTLFGDNAAQAASDQNEKIVFVNGRTAGETASLTAYVKVKKEDEEDEQEIEVGKLNVVSYDKVRERVFLVPVNGVSVPDVGAELNRIYGQAVAEWEVTVDEPFYVEAEDLAGLDDGESGMLASFPKKMRQFRRKFKKSRDIDKDAYYVFLIAEQDASDRSGFMPFKRKFGYVFTENLGGMSLAKVIAHELAHGAFRLRHTFSSEAYIAAQGSTDNLLDYSAGTVLRKYQWDLVHDPERMVGWFQDDEESEYSLADLVSIDVVNSINNPSTFFSQHGFVTPTGQAISLPNEVTKLRFSRDTGILYEFELNGTRYTLAESSNRGFLGYVPVSVITSLNLTIGDAASEEIQDRIEAERYNLTVLPGGKKVFTTIQESINAQVYAKCYCTYSWTNSDNQNELYGARAFKALPDNAIRGNCTGEECDDLNKVDEGAGTELYVDISRRISEEGKSLTAAEDLSLVELCNWISEITRAKKFAFYYPDLPDEVAQWGDVIKPEIRKYIYDNKLLTKAGFEQHFQVLESRDFEVVFSTIDLWDGIDKTSYNINSIDHKTKGLYHYSFADLKARYKLFNDIEDGSVLKTWIISAENEGKAEAISIKDGSEQYYARYETMDAYPFIASAAAEYTKMLLGPYFLNQLISQYGVVLTNQLIAKVGRKQLRQLIKEKGFDFVQGAIIDYGIQVIFNHIFNDNFDTFTEAAAPENINWVSVGTSAVEGTLSYKNKYLEFTTSTSLACIVNGFSNADGFTEKFDVEGCGYGVAGAIFGKGIGLGAARLKYFKPLAKYTNEQLEKGLLKLGITGKKVNDIIVVIKGKFYDFVNLKDLPDNIVVKFDENEWSEALLTKLDADLGDEVLRLNIIGNPNQLNCWKVLDEIGVEDAIRKNLGYLKNVDDYAKRSGKNADEVADLAKNNENGIEQFLDELEDTPASGHWDKNPFKRGQDIEDELGQNLPETFKTIDKFDFNNGDAVSIKSLDLDAKTYQTPSKLRSRLKKYLDELDGFSGHQQEGFRVGDVSGGTSITSKSLEIALPRLASGSQLQVINEIIADAASRIGPTNPNGIDVVIRVIP